MLKMAFNQNYPPKSKFGEDDVPDLSGKVVVVTGGSTGIGEETARVSASLGIRGPQNCQLTSCSFFKVTLAHNAKVYIACRSKGRAEAAIERLKKKTGKSDIHFLQLNLSSFDSIRKAAEELKEKETKLDVLFNNAYAPLPCHRFIVLRIIIPFLYTVEASCLHQSTSSRWTDMTCNSARTSLGTSSSHSSSFLYF